MKMRGKLLCLFSVLLLSITSIWNGNGMTCFAYDDTESESLKWCVYVNGEMPETILKKDETKEIVVPIKANATLDVEKITIDVKDTPFTVKGTPKIYREDTSGEVTNLGDQNHYLKFSLYAKKSTEDKTYNLNVSFLAGNWKGNLATYNLMDTIPVVYQTEEEAVQGKGSLTISDISCDNEMKVGESANVVYTLSNIGDGAATDITITYDGFGDDGILPDSNSTTKKITSLSANSEKSYTFPIKVANNAVTGAKKLSITVTYKSVKNAADYITETESFYVQVEGKATQDEKTVKAPKLFISNVGQSPAVPKAGGKVTLSFSVKNVGTMAAKNITLTPTSLSNTTFIPVDSDPSVFIQSLKIGASKKVSMQFTVAESVEKGLNSIEYAIAFKDANGTDFSDTAKLYIKNVEAKKEKKESSVGVPKLIIKEYSTGADIVTAGSEFIFAFDINNTHSSISADNIKVTITSDEAGTFSVAKGSNSFYISEIGAKSSIHKEIPIKVKADCTTKAYPLKVEFEYEYAGMEKPKDTLTSGLTVSETLNIQVEEDSRPALTNVLPGAYGELINGETNSITFDFTNRGKSPLYNVEVRISGDFQSTQESYFIGTVEAGTGTSHEMEITPMVEGTATGLMTVTYEDSNGKEGIIEQEFTGEVMMSSGMDFSGEEFMDPSMMGDMSAEDTAKKPIVKLPIFIVIQAVLFLAGIFIVRKITIARWRKKKILEEEKNL